MRVGVLGINHKLADLKLRELLAKACQRRFGAGLSTHGDHHFILLSTCNRTEVYFCSEDLAATHTYLLNIFRNEVNEEFDQKLYSYFGQDCFHHLSRVTAGLDSAIVAETEIQGQVKKTYEIAAQFSSLPEEMHYLFQKALKIGKKVRSTHLLNRGLPEIEHAIYNAGSHIFKHFHSTKILLVGVSAINQKILLFLKNKNLSDITICNRTEASALALAQTYQLQTLNWQQLTHWQQFDWIIFGTKAPHHLITSQDLPSLPITPKLIIDLSVPRNVDPTIARHSKVTLLNIDQINRMLTFRKQKMYHLLTQAEQQVLESSKQQTLLFVQKQQNRQQLLAVGT
jgi:glutamyl-tRNA reductase